MEELNVKQIQSRAREHLDGAAGGICWGELITQINAGAPEMPSNTIHGALQTLFASSDDIVKVARHLSAKEVPGRAGEQQRSRRTFL